MVMSSFTAIFVTVTLWPWIVASLGRDTAWTPAAPRTILPFWTDFAVQSNRVRISPTIGSSTRSPACHLSPGATAPRGTIDSIVRN